VPDDLTETLSVKQPRASLARRMGIIAAAWIFVLLLGGGIALERTLTTQVEANFDEQLDYILTAMIASAEIDASGEVYFYRTLGDQRFLEPGSGLYWQISGGNYDPWPSRSLWDRTLTLQGAAPTGEQFDSEVHFFNSDQFAGEPLRIAERTVILPGSETRWTFAVASATEQMDAQVGRVRLILIWSFAVLGLGLLVMTLLQIRYGLSPLRRVRAAIQNMRTTGANRITEPLPLEVQPLVEELNALLEHSERQAEEARRHAGNLAHALKTPLTVLTNAATARAPNLGEAVMRETRTMQRHVDHHLARARAVGRRAVGHARTNVMASAEAVRRAVEQRLQHQRVFVFHHGDDGRPVFRHRPSARRIGVLVERHEHHIRPHRRLPRRGPQDMRLAADATQLAHQRVALLIGGVRDGDAHAAQHVHDAAHAAAVGMGEVAR